jgi:hypothetical protein
MRALATASAILIVGILVWWLTYPQSSDPKNMRYVLWKAGVYKMDLDQATGTMIGDSASERMVVGKTKGELREKFGYLTLPVDATPYLRGCYENSAFRGKDVLFIRKSPWMVVFEGDKSTNLILVKGC